MERKERVLKEVGKVSVNFGSLTFASLVLGTIIRGEFDQWIILFGGVGLTFVLIVFGIILLSRREEK